MPNNRTDEVVSAVVAGVRQAILDQNVTFGEFRAAIGHLVKTAEAGELPLLIDVFFNTTVVQAINQHSAGSPSDLEGPYFLEDVPLVVGKVEMLDDDRNEPLIVRGTVRDPAGSPVAGATVFIWSSTPDGKYGGIHPGVPRNSYRARLITDAAGRFEVETTVPVPYQIPDKGPTGAMLEAMGRHSWRPAHVHFKVRADGHDEMTTQAYFAEGDYLVDDCCEGVVADELVVPRIMEGDKRLMAISLTLDHARHKQAA